ncbi:MAG: SRPBCC family protein [Actinomycetota bacterium]|nr:SRPBCC family protein [Actinomycetota bacterium]
MKIQNEIEVAAPPGELFDVLADVERVAPLLPGASLEGKEDDDTYAGTVKVKVGPITASYQGTLRFVELDHDSRRAVMAASADEKEGQGNLEARITASVSGSDSQSVLSLDTDLDVRGKAAQFGRGALGNVSQRILDQFARNLESEVLSGEGQTEETPSEGAEAGEETAPAREAEAPRASAAATAPAGEESLDLLSVVGTPALRQVAPAVAGLVLGLLIGNYVSSRKTLLAYQEAMRLMSYGQLHGPPTSKWWRRPGH